MIGRYLNSTKEHGKSQIAHKAVEPAISSSNVTKESLPVSKVAGTVIGVLGAKGGSGVSTLALNLAICLSQKDSAVAVVDAHLQEPQLATMLHRDPKFTLLDVVSRAPDIDLHLLEACAERISSDCLLLSPPLDGQASFTRNLSELADALVSMRSLMSYCVVDLPRHLDRHLVNVLDQCTMLLVVFEPTLAGVGATTRWLNLFQELDYEPSKVLLAANRCGPKTREVENDLNQCFSAYKLVKLPNDFNLCQQCLLSGQPAMLSKPGSAYSRSVLSLSQVLAEHVR